MVIKLICLKCQNTKIIRCGTRQNKHATVFRYKCKKCGKRFSSYNNIRHHVVSLAYEKPLKIKKYKLVEYDFKTQSFKFIKEALIPTDDVSSEQLMKRYYESKKYNVTRLSSAFIKNGTYYSIKGLPDLLIEKNNKKQYVEVKINRGGPTLEQFIFLQKKGGKIVWLLDFDKNIEFDNLDFPVETKR